MSTSRSTSNRARKNAADGPWTPSSARWPGMSAASAANTISTCSTSSRCPDFNMGAMENKGLNVFNDRLILASPETATDTIYQAIESVVAHEYFHNWTGNRITCRGLVPALPQGRPHRFPRPGIHGRRARRDRRAHHFPCASSAPTSSPRTQALWPTRCGRRATSRSTTSYTATVYEKGAELVRMIQTICGRDGFRAGMDLYLSRHDGDAATVEDFITCFRGSGEGRPFPVPDLVPASGNARAGLRSELRPKEPDGGAVRRAGVAFHPGRSPQTPASYSPEAGPSRWQWPGYRVETGERHAR